MYHMMSCQKESIQGGDVNFFLVFQTPPNNAILQTAIIHRDPDYPWDAHRQS